MRSVAMPTLTELRRAKKLAKLPADKAELDNLRERAKTSLRDAKIAGLSVEAQFKCAYDAARQTAVVAIRASGYRVTAKLGHHAATFEAVEALDARFKAFVDFFDASRSKRNDLEYSAKPPPSESDATDLVAEVERFAREIDTWIASRFPELG